MLLRARGVLGTEYLPVWWRTLRDAPAAVPLDDLYVVDCLDPRRPPPWVRPGAELELVLPEDPDSWILIDSERRLMHAYGLDPDAAHLLLFDSAGNLRARVSGTEPRPELVEQFARMIRKVLAER